MCGKSPSHGSQGAAAMSASLSDRNMHNLDLLIQRVLDRSKSIAGDAVRAKKHVPLNTPAPSAAALIATRITQDSKSGQIWRWVLSHPNCTSEELVNGVILHGDDDLYYDYRTSKSRSDYIKSERSACLRALRAANLYGAQENEIPINLATPPFDPFTIDDAREKVLSDIVRRRGQAQFRNDLLKAYGGKCVISECSVQEVLDAAHIHPYFGARSNSVTNGLLLRTDIHALFDLRLISVATDSITVCTSPALADTEYGQYNGKKLLRPNNNASQASAKALAWHRAQCNW